MENPSKLTKQYIPRLNGAYVLRHLKSGKLYVGSAKDLAKRVQLHRSDLKLGVHANKKLQNLYTEDSGIEFEYYITENREEAYDYEQKLLDHYWNSGLIVNVSYDARISARGRQYKHTEAAKEKIRQAKIGKKLSFDHVEKIRLSNTGKKRSPEMVEILKRNRVAQARSVSLNGKMYESVAAAAVDLGVSRATIRNRLNKETEDGRI